ncbi:MAG: hypothetical protein IH985_05505 [Planctomycetes bacterium]|nr:hypothetical protein [Planctomycetota bacterium]
MRIATPEKSDVAKKVAQTRRLKIRIEVPADAKHQGGLAVFGERLGRFPADPTIVLRFDAPHGLGRDFRSDKPVAVRRLVAARETLLPTAEAGGAEWRFTTTDPADGWMQPDFDDTGWKTGRGGFGTEGTPNARIGTRWNSPAIWLRTTVTVPAGSEIVAAILRFYHDEDVTIFINGKRVARRRGYVSHYIEQSLDAAGRSALREGENTIAVRCRQTGGGQNIDVGLDVVRRGE